MTELDLDSLLTEYLETAEYCLRIAVKELRRRIKDGECANISNLVELDAALIPFIRETALAFLEEKAEDEEFSRRINGGDYD